MAIKHFGSCTKNKPIGNAKVTSGHLRQSLPWDQVLAEAPESAGSCLPCRPYSPWATPGGSPAHPATLAGEAFPAGQYLLQLLFVLSSPSDAT